MAASRSQKRSRLEHQRRGAIVPRRLDAALDAGAEPLPLLERLRLAGDTPYGCPPGEAHRVGWGCSFGSSEEVARSCVFLCSKDGDYITGAELSITGGVFM
jgi:NAD(P)-dependent dehydrogenase (short-subunit alcohol dehydrogenase family)